MIKLKEESSYALESRQTLPEPVKTGQERRRDRRKKRNRSGLVTMAKNH